MVKSTGCPENGSFKVVHPLWKETFLWHPEYAQISPVPVDCLLKSPVHWWYQNDFYNFKSTMSKILIISHILMNHIKIHAKLH